MKKEGNKPNKKKFSIRKFLKKLFRKKHSKLDKLLIKFFKGKGFKEFAQEQSKAQQEHHYRLKEIERKNRIKERCDYLQYRKDNGFKMTDEQQEEHDFCKFFVKNKIA